MPQVHQVLPRVARLMVALRADLFGPWHEECSYLFVVNGKGRHGMGLHHDGNVEAIWVQLEGRRTVTTGPPVARSTPEDLGEETIEDDWKTRHLDPGSLFYLPPYTPHRVVCHGRSLALSLTWDRRICWWSERRDLHAPTGWDVAQGQAMPIPRASRDRLWTQVPVRAGVRNAHAPRFALHTPDGAVRLSSEVWPLASRLSTMPELRRSALTRRDQPLLDLGILGGRDLPLRIVPKSPRALDGWRFA